MIALRLTLQLLWRNWRGGEVKILSAALVLAVTVVTAIAVFGNRMESSLARQSNSYLAADRVVSSRFAIPQEWLNEPARFQLAQAQTARFSSMVYAGDQMQLASIKAVSEGYPLRGQLEVSDQAFATGDEVRIATNVPAPGEVWVDSRLLPLMELELGDQLTIGEKAFYVRQLVIREPDTRVGFSMLGPRVMMNMADLEATGVILPGSRVRYRWLLAGEENQLNALAEWLKPRLGEHYRWMALAEAQRNVGEALDRGKRFLLLAGMIGVLLASVAISIAAQQFARRQVDAVALIKSLGASARKVRFLFAAQLVVLGITASLVGLLLGELLQRAIAASLSSLFKIELLNASIAPYSAGLLTGMLCLVCFALPPLWHLPGISPLKVLRRELPVNPVKTWMRGLVGLVAVVALIGYYSADVMLTLAVVLGLLAIIIVVVLVSLVLLYSSQQLGSRAGSVWRLALANLKRHRSQTITQMMVFGCALMLLMVLYVVRTGLIDEWRLQLPDDAPNHFVLNIAPYERDSVLQLFDRNQLQPSPLYPMVLGRVVGVNDYTYQDSDRDLSNSLRRELNLSWAETLAPDNQLLAGQWWDSWQPTAGDQGLPGVSVEAEVADELSLKLGDVLTFSIGGLRLQAEIASIRSVDWNAMTPNFYFLFSPGALTSYSPNYLTSVYIPPEQKRFVNTLLRQHPTILVLEVDRIIERIRLIVSQVSRTVELVLWVVLVGGVLVLIAAVNASMNSRLQEAGLLRALGSPRRLLLGSLWLEFSLLGGAAGVLAVLGSETLLLGLQAWVFEQPLRPHYELWVTGPVVGAIFIGLLGLIACRKTVTIPPGVVLRGVAV